MRISCRRLNVTWSSSIDERACSSSATLSVSLKKSAVVSGDAHEGRGPRQKSGWQISPQLHLKGVPGRFAASAMIELARSSAQACFASMPAR
jgi:hypothetical protein